MKRDRKSSGEMFEMPRSKRAKKNKLTTKSQAITTYQPSRSIDENPRIPTFDEINLRYPPDEDEPYAGLFRSDARIDCQNSPDPLLTPQSRRTTCNLREYFQTHKSHSVHKKEEESDEEEEIIWRPKSVSNTPMTDYANQYGIYLASIQGAKDFREICKEVTTLPPKRLFTQENEKSGESENIAKNVIETSNEEPLKGVAVYVEVFSDSLDQSPTIAQVLKRLGATIRFRLTKTVAVVVFKTGNIETYMKAKKLKIPIVTALWVQACDLQKKFVALDEFVPSGLKKYDETPELVKKEGCTRRNRIRQIGKQCYRWKMSKNDDC